MFSKSLRPPPPHCVDLESDESETGSATEVGLAARILERQRRKREQKGLDKGWLAEEIASEVRKGIDKRVAAKQAKERLAKRKKNDKKQSRADFEREFPHTTEAKKRRQARGISML